MDLSNIKLRDIETKATEVKSETITIDFEFEDGKLVNEELQGLYDYIQEMKPKEEEPTEENTDPALY